MAQSKPQAAAFKPSAPTGNAGELQQQAQGKHPVLTTQQGIPVPDNQNSLKAWERGPTLRTLA